MNKVELLHIVIGGKDVLVRSTQVKEIVRPGPLTSVPMGPEHLMGLSNVHGQIVCIIDAGKCSALPASSQGQTSYTRILILRDPVKHVGIWVDQIKKLLRLNDSEMVDATAKAGDTVTLEIEGNKYALLDCSKLLHTTISNY